MKPREKALIFRCIQKNIKELPKIRIIFGRSHYTSIVSSLITLSSAANTATFSGKEVLAIVTLSRGLAPGQDMKSMTFETVTNRELINV